MNSSSCRCPKKKHNKKKHHHKKHTRHHHKNHQQVIVNNYLPKAEKTKTDYVPPNPPSTTQGMHMDVPYSLLLNQKNMYNRLLDNQQKSVGEPVYVEQDSSPQPASAPGTGRKQRADKGRLRGPYKKGGGGGASMSRDTMAGDGD